MLAILAQYPPSKPPGPPAPTGSPLLPVTGLSLGGAVVLVFVLLVVAVIALGLARWMKWNR